MLFLRMHTANYGVAQPNLYFVFCFVAMFVPFIYCLISSLYSSFIFQARVVQQALVYITHEPL